MGRRRNGEDEIEEEDLDIIHSVRLHFSLPRYITKIHPNDA